MSVTPEPKLRLMPLSGWQFCFSFSSRGKGEKGGHFNWSTVNEQNCHDECLDEGGGVSGGAGGRGL